MLFIRAKSNNMVVKIEKSKDNTMDTERERERERELMGKQCITINNYCQNRRYDH